MATLISSATGNWTASGTWKLADSASEQDGSTTTGTSTTAYVGSSTFTPGAITVDAIGIKVSSRSSSPTGTFSVDLYNSTGAIQVAEVTVNVSDIALTGGWYILPITPTLLLAATNYQVRIKSSTTGQVVVWRNATSNNWTRQLRTTTNQAPAAGDKLLIAGEHTGAGTGNDFTITMNETATTIYGSTTFGQSITVSKRSTLQYGTTASTNYYLKVAGFIWLYESGTFTIGTSGTPIPASSTAVLEFSCTAAADSGLIVGEAATFNTFGATVIDRARLAADAAVAATTVTTDVSTGWLSGDEIAFAPTARTAAQYEKRTLSANAVGTSVSITAGLTYAHDGTSPYAAGEVILLTRNVKVRSVSTTLVAYTSYAATAVANIQYTEFTKLGTSSSIQTAMTVNTTTGSLTVENCSFYEISVAAASVFRFLASAADNINISDCVFYNNVYLAIYFSVANTTPASSLLLDNCWFIGGATGIQTSNTSLVTSNCRFSGLSSALLYSTSNNPVPMATVSNCVAHANSTGFSFVATSNGTVTDLEAFRNTGFGLEWTNGFNMIAEDIVLRGNATGNMRFTTLINSRISNITLVSESGFTTPYGLYLAADNPNTIIYNATFGGTAAEDHTTGDIVSTGQLSSCIFHSSTFNSPTEYPLSINKPGTSYQSQKHQNTAGNDKIVAYEGTITRDTTIYNSASPSLRMSPARSFVKLMSPLFTTAVKSGNTVTIQVNIRQSVVGDGTAYNGAAPRLIVRANPVAGILTDTVLDTASGAAGSWELLSGTTAAVSENTILEFYVDCDGTTGWVNVDDALLPSAATADFSVWRDGGAAILGSGQGESSSTFVG